MHPGFAPIAMDALLAVAQHALVFRRVALLPAEPCPRPASAVGSTQARGMLPP